MRGRNSRDRHSRSMTCQSVRDGGHSSRSGSANIPHLRTPVQTDFGTPRSFLTPRKRVMNASGYPNTIMFRYLSANLSKDQLRSTEREVHPSISLLIDTDLTKKNTVPSVSAFKSWRAGGVTVLVPGTWRSYKCPSATSGREVRAVRTETLYGGTKRRKWRSDFSSRWILHVLCTSHLHPHHHRAFCASHGLSTPAAVDRAHLSARNYVEPISMRALLLGGNW